MGLLTHDVGDTVGGELLARQLDGEWDVEITDRTVANGSLYMELAQLSAGQQFLLGLPDARLAEDAPRTGTPSWPEWPPPSARLPSPTPTNWPPSGR